MLSIDEVKKVAKLAKFNLSDAEVEKFQKLLSEALDYIKVLDEVNTSSVVATSQVTGLTNSFSQDVSLPSLSVESAVKNAKRKNDKYIITDLVVKKAKV